MYRVSTSAARLAKLCSAVTLLLVAGIASGQKAARDLTEASLEDLLNIEVTTVSKKEQKLARAPAAVYVITQEDIRRSGMSSIPDLLRIVPGLQVGQIQGGAWAVSARGFNDEYANKLLVLVDGRSVYSPINAGVNWQELNSLLEDIERIEVIRGPGGTLWGANAVNGVVNIITKVTKQTHGALVSAGVGDQGQSLGAFRYGGRFGDKGDYRASVKYLGGRGLSNGLGQSILDGERSVHAGFRADWTLSGRDTLMVDAGAFRGHANSEVSSSILSPPFLLVQPGLEQNQGGDVMARWTRRQSTRSTTALQVYYEHSNIADPNFRRAYSSLDLDFQNQLALSDSNDLVWGIGFRDSASHSSGSFSTSLSTPKRNDPLLSGFVQDQFTFAQGKASFVLGSKFEHNNFTGVEVEPGARFVWAPAEHHTLWTALSRAVRAPSAIDDALLVNQTSGDGLGPPVTARISGDTSFRSEHVLAYELGYRLQVMQRFSLDFTTFYDVFHRLRTIEPGVPFFEQVPRPAHLVIPLHFSNQMAGETYGAELTSNFNVTQRWRLVPAYSWLRLDARLDPASRDTTSLTLEGKSPRRQFHIRSNLDLSQRLQFDTAAYYVGALPALSVPAYTRLDARFGYRPRSGIEISFTGQNLQGGRHAEFVSISPYTRATIGRSFFVKCTLEF